MIGTSTLKFSASDIGPLLNVTPGNAQEIFRRSPLSGYKQVTILSHSDQGISMVYSASTAFLEALVEGGIKYIYGNFGSDHPAILESLAEARITGRKMPEVITCPIEQVGLHIAMGYAHVHDAPEGSLG